MYLIANWKMYLDLEESVTLAKKMADFSVPDAVKLIVCPTHLALNAVYKALPPHIGRGAQNGYWVEKGAYTGAVSMAMLKAAGCEYVLVGHSEVRYQFRETNEEVAKKMRAAWEWGLQPILCIGETKEELHAGSREAVLREQLGAVFVDCKDALEECFVSYEPVWAISHGTAGKNCAPEDLAEVMQTVVKWIGECVEVQKVHFLYGGSVTPENVRSYMDIKHLEGVLVGAASTHADKVQGLLKALS